MGRRLRQVVLLPVLAILILTPLAGLDKTEAQSDQRCFRETNQCISGEIRRYWETNGGLPVFGYPITSVSTVTIEDPAGNWTGPVQWFERDRLEDHTVQGQGVLAGRLGADLLELKGTPWETFNKVSSAAAGCRFFAETGHSLCEPFLSYWSNNGGLTRFGYPITEPFQDTIENWTGTVQYFERRRMEHHTELAGTGSEVLLGLLGREVYNFEPPEDPPVACTTTVIPELQATYNRYGDSLRESMGCPRAVHTDIPAAIQTMENGVMIWTRVSEADQRIYTYVEGRYYAVYPDTFQEGVDPEQPDVQPPEGLFAPRRGFGKVWINNPNLREDIGWALERNERAETATVQDFDTGVMVWVKGTGNVLGGGSVSYRYSFGPR